MQARRLFKLGAIVLVAAAVVVTLLVKHAESDVRPGTPAVTATLPKLLDLGSDKCIPCKKMAPILDALRNDFAGRFDVVFVDVWKDRQAAVSHKIWVIPTQIFFDEDGNELFRHEGFFSRADILATWSEVGYAFSSPQDEDEVGEPPPVASSGEPATAGPPTEPAQDPSDPAGSASKVVLSEGDGKVIAYYFHWTNRCHTCLEIEQYSHTVMLETFGDELDAGRLDWHAHNMELPEYEHFQREFDLSTPSLVLVRLEAGVIAEWRVLGKVWDLIETPSNLQTYVRAQTREYLAAAFGPG
jgi:thioredoxin 1